MIFLSLPCIPDNKKKLSQIACGIMSSADNNYVLVELIVLRLFLVGVMMVNTCPSEWVSPMRPLKLVFTT